MHGKQFSFDTDRTHFSPETGVPMYPEPSAANNSFASLLESESKAGSSLKSSSVAASNKPTPEITPRRKTTQPPEFAVATFKTEVLGMVDIKKNSPAQLILSIKQGILGHVSESAWDSKWQEQWQDAVNSGELVLACIEEGYIDLAQELIEYDHLLPPTILVDAIRLQNENLIFHTINSEFYSQEFLVLSFWLLLEALQLDYAQKLLNQSSTLQEICDVDKISSENAPSLQIMTELMQPALRSALCYDHSDVSFRIITLNDRVVDSKIIDLALDNAKIKFLLYVWETQIPLADRLLMRHYTKSDLAFQQVGQTVKTESQYLDISYVVDQLLQRKYEKEVKEILSMSEVCSQPGVLDACVAHAKYDLAMLALKNNQVLGLRGQHLAQILEHGYFDLVVEMLKIKTCRTILKDHDFQSKILSLLLRGHTCYYAIELISWIKPRDWNYELTRTLCRILQVMAKKTEELLMCHHSLLFIVLCSEFLHKLADFSLEARLKCKKTANMMETFGTTIQKSIKVNEHLMYLMTQEDSRGRSVFTIVSENRVYDMLELDNIEEIVKNLWIGKSAYYGFHESSTLYKSLEAPISSFEAHDFASRMNRNKPYVFQYQQWTESCRLRFFAQELSTLFLVFVYTMLIHTATQAGVMDDVTADPTPLTYLRIAQGQITAIFIEELWHIAFGFLTKRGYKVDGWKLVNLLMFVQMIILAVDLHKSLMGEGNPISFIEPTTYNTLLHGSMLVLVWLKFVSILIAHKTHGPTIRMIYRMAIESFLFFIVYICFNIAAASVFASIFSHRTHNPQFSSFYESFKTMFAFSLGAFDLEIFEEDIRAFGIILVSLFLLFSLIILLKLLIAIYTDIYENFVHRVDAEYNSNLINYYNRYRWNQKYGILILLPPPFTYLTLIFAPFVIFSRNPKKWNNRFSRIVFIIYVIPQFCIFAILSFFFIIPAWIQSIYSWGKTGSLESHVEQTIFGQVNDEAEVKFKKQNTQERESVFKRSMTRGSVLGLRAAQDAADGRAETSIDEMKVIKYRFSKKKAGIWLAIGLPYIIVAYIRDLVDFCTLVYADVAQITDFYTTNVNEHINERALISLQKVIKITQTKKISYKNFLETWLMIDEQYITPEMIQDGYAMRTRDLAFRDYTEQLVVGKENKVIDLEILKVLLPKQTYYTLPYVIRAQYIQIPVLLRGINRFHRKLGMVNVGKHTFLPKMLIQGETPDLKRLTSEFIDLDVSFYTVNIEYKTLLDDVKKMTKKIRRFKKDEDK